MDRAFWIGLIMMLGTAFGQECREFYEVGVTWNTVHPYAGSVVVQRVGKFYRLGVPWQKVPGYGVEKLEITPIRGRDMGQPFAYTDKAWCYDNQIKYWNYDGKLFWIQFPAWMMNGGCYQAVIFRFGLNRQSIEKRQYGFCYNP